MHMHEAQNGLSKTMSHPTTFRCQPITRTFSQLINSGVAMPSRIQNNAALDAQQQYLCSFNTTDPSHNRTSMLNSSYSNHFEYHSLQLIDDESIKSIASGEDQRTYVMMRNIPNQYTREKLISEINETHEGTFYLLHLPIDSTSKLNKGYSFMDFHHPLFLVDFYKTYNGCSWKQAAKSTKKIQFSYGKRDKP
jgi:hypothetical protein